MASLRKDAVRAFGALYAFDPDATQRIELAAAGVSDHRIHLLYGRAYPALIPGLATHLRNVAPDRLHVDGRLDAQQPFTVLEALPAGLAQLEEVEDEKDADELLAKNLQDELIDQLVERFKADCEAGPTDLTPGYIEIAIGVAYRLQVMHDQLPHETAAQADELMVAVAYAIGL